MFESVNEPHKQVLMMVSHRILYTISLFMLWLLWSNANRFSVCCLFLFWCAICLCVLRLDNQPILSLLLIMKVSLMTIFFSVTYNYKQNENYADKFPHYILVCHDSRDYYYLSQIAQLFDAINVLLLSVCCSMHVNIVVWFWEKMVWDANENETIK